VHVCFHVCICLCSCVFVFVCVCVVYVGVWTCVLACTCVCVVVLQVKEALSWLDRTKRTGCRAEEFAGENGYLFAKYQVCVGGVIKAAVTLMRPHH
jgi:hypothetical protein